jgi:hypothetical protein
MKPVLVTGLYVIAMGGLFLAATVSYLVIEFFYVGGRVFW